MRLQKLYDVFVPGDGDREIAATKKADAFGELVQCLDDRSLSLVIRKDERQRALEVLRQHYQGKGKPCVIALYTELTTLKKRDNESTVDYVIRAKTAATALRGAEEVISDATKKIMGTMNTRLYLDLVIVMITYVLLVKTIIAY